MLSSIWVATITGLPAARQARMICRWIVGHLLGRHLDAEIAARHHERVGEVDDLLEPLDRGRLLQLGHDRPARRRGAHLVHVLRPLHEGERDPVGPELEGEGEVGAVLVGQGETGSTAPAR